VRSILRHHAWPVTVRLNNCVIQAIAGPGQPPENGVIKRNAMGQSEPSGFSKLLRQCRRWMCVHECLAKLPRNGANFCVEFSNNTYRAVHSPRGLEDRSMVPYEKSASCRSRCPRHPVMPAALGDCSRQTVAIAGVVSTMVMHGLGEWRR